MMVILRHAIICPRPNIAASPLPPTPDRR